MKTAKAWTAGLGPVVAGILQTYAGLPEEVCIAIGTAVSVVLTYLVPNKE